MLSEEEKKQRKVLYQRSWRKRNPNYASEYHQKNKEKRHQQNKEWRINNKKHYNKLQRKYNRQNRMKIIEALGNKCVKCGFSDWRALQVDHIEGDGAKDRRKMGTTSYYRHILENIKTNPEKFQLLCANCNWIKRYERDEVPNKA